MLLFDGWLLGRLCAALTAHAAAALTLAAASFPVAAAATFGFARPAHAAAPALTAAAAALATAPFPVAAGVCARPMLGGSGTRRPDVLLRRPALQRLSGSQPVRPTGLWRVRGCVPGVL